MRRFYWLFLALMCIVSSCALIDTLAGIHRDKAGKVIMVDEQPIADNIFSTIGYLFPTFGWAATAGTAAIREYRHHQILKSGGKDDDRDGRPDPEPSQGTTT